MGWIATAAVSEMGYKATSRHVAITAALRVKVDIRERVCAHIALRWGLRQPIRCRIVAHCRTAGLGKSWSGQDMTKRKAPGRGREPIALGEPIDPDLLQRDADHELPATRKIDTTNKASLLEMLTYCRGRA